MEKLYITTEEHEVLTDLRFWMNRIHFKGNRGSGRQTLVVDQNINNLGWRCSCTTYNRHKDCSHLRLLNLPGGGVPYEIAGILNVDNPIRLHMLRLRQQRRVGLTKWEEPRWTP